MTSALRVFRNYAQKTSQSEVPEGYYRNVAELVSKVADAMEAARMRPIVTVEPQVEDRDGEMMLTIPAEAGYSLTAISMKDMN